MAKTSTKTPVWLHPATLRWVANFAIDEAFRYKKFRLGGRPLAAKIKAKKLYHALRKHGVVVKSAESLKRDGIYISIENLAKLVGVKI